MGVGYICEGLTEQQKGGLQTLVLWNTQVTSHGAGYLANALVGYPVFLIPLFCLSNKLHFLWVTGIINTCRMFGQNKRKNLYM